MSGTFAFGKLIRRVVAYYMSVFPLFFVLVVTRGNSVMRVERSLAIPIPSLWEILISVIFLPFFYHFHMDADFLDPLTLRHIF